MDEILAFIGALILVILLLIMAGIFKALIIWGVWDLVLVPLVGIKPITFLQALFIGLALSLVSGFMGRIVGRSRNHL